MMKNLLKNTALFMLLAFLTFGCSEDDETEIDFRQEAIGVYEATTVVSVNGQTASFTEDMIVSLSGSTRITLLFDDGSDFDLVGLRDASNGFAFNITTVTQTDGDGDDYVVAGTNSFTIESENFDGRYNSGSGKLEFQASITYVDPQFSEFNGTITVEAFKKEL